MADLLQSTLEYAAKGWAVLPLRPRSKEPLTDHGFKDASTDPMVILDWWQRWPDANIGIATGAPSGLLVLDVDPRHGGDDALRDLERQHGPLPDTIEALTGGGGRHIFFHCPNGQGCNKLADGIDIKANGGYVVAAPSVHPSGVPYTWEVAHHPDDVALADPPGWLLAMLAKAKPSSAAAAPGDGRIPTGQRNATLTSLGGAMRRRGATQEAIEAALLAENSGRCDPPLPEAEVKRIAASVARYDPVAGGEADLQKDYGHAAVLATLFKDRYRWAATFNSWHAYTDGAWRPVPEESVAKVAADELRRHYAARLAGATDKTVIQDLAKKVAETCVFARITGALSFLKGWPGILTLPEEWDANPWLLNCRNGTLDLRTGTLRPHDPADLLTKQAGAAYEPGPAPRWQAHLELFLPDPDVRRQVQRDLGVALVGASLEESLPIWHGTGANGKSTTLRVIMAVMGDHAQTAAPRLLLASKYERHTTELAELRGKRLVFSAETGEQSRLDEERVKMLTGGERIRAHFMRQDNIEFERTWTIFLVTNHRPEIRGADNGIWRRVRLVPWTVSLPRERQRPQEAVVGELLSERGAILAWLVAGLRDWQQDHHWRAEAVRVATDSYRAEQDILGGFLADRCEIGPRLVVEKKLLYDAYAQWCGTAGEEPLSKTDFGRQLRARGIADGRKSSGVGARIWRGIRLLPISDTDSRSSQEISDSRGNTENVSEIGNTDAAPAPAGDEEPPVVRIQPRRVVVDRGRLQELVDSGVPYADAVDLAAVEGPPGAEYCTLCGIPTLNRDPDGWPLCTRCAERAAEEMMVT